MATPVIEMRGHKYGRLTPLYRATDGRWFCICDCGEDRLVNGSYLRDGQIKSCGCRKKEAKTHGFGRHPLSGIWRGMIKRCHNEAHPAYKSYGARGIYVCDRWRYSIENFVADMSPRPAGLSLERKDNNGPYSPENCVWATRAQQANNRTTSRFLDFNGERKTLSQWSVATGIKRTTLAARLDVYGMDVATALTLKQEKQTEAHLG